MSSDASVIGTGVRVHTMLSKPPSKPHPSTTNQGGTFQNIKATRASNASPKSPGLKIALVQTGLYKAARSNPTTPALTPASAAWVRTLCRKCSQNGKAPITSRNEGTKIATRHSVAPAQPEGWTLMEAPRKAEKVRSGPGTACARP